MSHINKHIYSFNSSGKFISQIGNLGQGPGEYQLPISFFSNADKSTIFIEDHRDILEYEFDGSFVRSYQKATVEGEALGSVSYVGDDLFVGRVIYTGKNKYNYCLFDQNGNAVKCFPNHFFSIEQLYMLRLMTGHLTLYV